jgi:long-chain acyl-CoA synthetase
MDFRRLFDLLHYQLARYPQKVALAHKHNHRWQTYSTKASIEIINQASAGLMQEGLKKGDCAAIMTHQGSAIWNLLDFALQQIGVVVVPIHATIHARDMEYILKDAEVKCCFCGSLDLYEKVEKSRHQLPHLKKSFLFGPNPEGIPSFQDLLIEPEEKHLAAFQTFRAVIHPDDPATIIYTSGTTGKPKGVVLSHHNIVSNIKAIISLIPVNCDQTTLSYLPLSHVFERMVTYTYMAVGASLYYAESLDKLQENMQEIRPHYLASVPRMLEKMYERILQSKLRLGKLSKRILNWAIALGERFDERKQRNLFYVLQLRLASILVYSRWRRSLGGRVLGIVVGAAPLQEKLARLFSAAGIDIREGYGLTETSPVVSFNRFDPGLNRFGTVGIPLPGVEVMIDEPNENGNGEIWVKGPNVMKGYHKQPEETAAVMTQDGWFKTGDVGRMVDSRFLKITDRKKDIFKTSSGKYIAPQSIENLLKTSEYIEQCLVVGYRHSFVSALIVPSFPVLEAWCEENNVHWTAAQYMVINPKVEELMQSVIEELNEQLEPHEQIRKFLLLYEEWLVKDGEITPTLKPVRAIIEQKHEEKIKQLYT